MTDPRPADADDPDLRPAPPLELRWRTVYDAPPPRRIRLEVPGWGGPSGAHGDGAPAQPWHCRPFVEGAAYGLELVYPYRSECRVRMEDGVIHFEGGLAEEMAEAGLPHPFGAFAAEHYGMATALDLLPPPGHALRLGPHPRYFTDGSGEVPLALPGHLRRFWPRQFFAVFRAPPPGAVHVFRPGEAYAQLLVVPAEQAYALAPMEAEEADDRARQDRQITLFGYFLSKRIWRSEGAQWFDDKYKQLLRRFRRGGVADVRAHLQATEERMTPRPRGEKNEERA
ncbi:MAG TPA: hypothetical protein VHG91_03600 [Longimicrobium sp.]|nr:hypothetical protein [Longimicrobium sp.]